MSEIKNNLEQLMQVSRQGEAGSQDVVNGVEDNEQGSKFGKFKDVDALLQAYNNLQSDYTKKCQSLSLLQKESRDNENVTPDIPKYDYLENAKDFFATNQRAKKYEDKLTKIIIEDKDVASSQNPLSSAWNKFLNSKFLDEEELVNNQEFLNQYIFNNESIKNKIIQEYFNSLNMSKSPTLISSQKGSESILTPVTKPKTIKEARKLVEDMFN